MFKFRSYNPSGAPSALDQTPLVLTSTAVDCGYLPGRGLIYSLIVHGIVFSGLLLIPLFTPPMKLAEQSRLQERVTMINLRDPNYALYLPILLGGGGSSAPEEEGSNVSRPERPSASAAKPKGFSYPGPQSIVSDLPEPTNRIQSVLQPKLTNLPILPPLLLLPNIVQMPVAPPVSPERVPDEAPAAVQRPVTPPAVPLQLNAIELPVKVEPPPINIPKVVQLPVETASAPELKLPEAPSKSEPPTVPQNPVQETIPPGPAAKEVEPLLVISPMPTPPEESVNVPSGEARGSFAISPEPNPVTSATEPGSPFGTPVSKGGDASREAGINSGSSAGPKDKGAADGGTENGRNARGGPVPGSGGSSGSGAGGGKSSNPFAGITILGGASNTGSIGKTGTSPNIISIGGPPKPIQTSYGVTIISTEAGGGGLPQFGLFSNESIYTVYLDMRRTMADSALSWTLEYAMVKGTSNASNVIVSASPSQQGLVLPFPVLKEHLALPVELLQKYRRRRVIVYTVLNVEGKMGEITVKESPDTLLNEHIINALSRWVFRPAQLDGKIVPIRVLIGIPLS